MQIAVFTYGSAFCCVGLYPPDISTFRARPVGRGVVVTIPCTTVSALRLTGGCSCRDRPHVSASDAVLVRRGIIRSAFSVASSAERLARTSPIRHKPAPATIDASLIHGSIAAPLPHVLAPIAGLTGQPSRFPRTENGFFKTANPADTCASRPHSGEFYIKTTIS